MSAALPRAAVVVPVFNGARTLPDCLASLRALDYPAERLEVIVVDNASTDASPRILAAAGPPVRALHEPRRGASAARNRGIAASTPR